MKTEEQETIKTTSEARKAGSAPRFVLDSVRDSKIGRLTLGQLHDLTKKDKELLTPTERTQLKEFEKLSAALAEALSANTNLTDAFKGFNAGLSQALKAYESAAALSEGLAQAFSSTKRFSDQVAGLAIAQQSLLNAPLMAAKNLQNLMSAPLAVGAMFADFRSFHLRVVDSLSLDLSTLSASTRFSDQEAVSLDFQSVTEQLPFEASFIATRERSASGLVQIERASLTALFDKLDTNSQELAEIKRALLTEKQQGPSLVSPAKISFQRNESSLYIADYDVPVRQSSLQAQFTAVFFGPEGPSRQWDIEDFILEAFGSRLGIDGELKGWIRKIRSHIHALNNRIERVTRGGCINFFLFVDGLIFINPQYLPKP